MPQPLDLRGQRFGRLMALEPIQGNTRTDRRRQYRCQCDCGTECVVTVLNLRDGSTTSCGCRRRETMRALQTLNLTHGQSRTAEYTIWRAIIARCENPNSVGFAKYAGRDFEPEFRQSFEAWVQHVGKRPSPKHTIERIDNNLGYVRGNMRWATRLEQANNKRNNRRVTYQGRTQTVPDWCRELNLPYHTIRKRFADGWSVELTFTTPIISGQKVKRQSR